MGGSRRKRDKRGHRSRSRSLSKSKSRSRSRSRSKERAGRRHAPSGSSGGRHYDNLNARDNRKRGRRYSDNEDDGHSDDGRSPAKSNRLQSKREEQGNQRRRESDRRHNDRESEGNKASSSGEIALSIEETNKIRIQLGLKPLEQDDGKGEGEDGTKTKEVFVKTGKISEKINAEKIRDRLETQRQKRKIADKLKRTRGLADDSEDEDAAAWIEKNRLIAEEKRKAEEQERMLQEMDKEVAEQMERERVVKREKAYSARDLSGLTVGHSSEWFNEGQQVVLTLRDKAVLAEDDVDDVLENVNILDDERAAKNLVNKKNKPRYTPYDDEEFDEFGILQKKNLLNKYDEEIEGEKKESFKLSGAETNLEQDKEMELVRMRLKMHEGSVSLEGPKLKLATEYYSQEDMEKFKKPKKVVKQRGMRKKATKELLKQIEEAEASRRGTDHGSRSRKEHDTDEPMNVDRPKPSTAEAKIKPLIAAAEDDDDDIAGQMADISGIQLEEDELDIALQKSLQKTRKLMQKDQMESSQVRLAEEIMVERLIKQEQDDDNAESGKMYFEPVRDTNLTLNSTAEFCRNLGDDISTWGLAGNRGNEEDEVDQSLLDFERNLMEERKKQKEEKDEEDMEVSERESRGYWNEVNLVAERVDQKDVSLILEQVILEEEPDVTRGLAGALQLAKKKGYIDKEIKKAAGQIGSVRASGSQLEARNYRIEEKFYEEEGKGGRNRERYKGPVSEFRDKNNYKPNVKLEYIGDDGRVLNEKEAFRYLSHKFHGKGPGKNKIDKRIKKHDQDGRLKQMSSTDTPLGTLKMLQMKQKELQTPYVILSGTQTTLTKSKNS